MNQLFETQRFSLEMSMRFSRDCLELAWSARVKPPTLSISNSNPSNALNRTYLKH
jgi:hypothetical protein